MPVLYMHQSAYVHAWVIHLGGNKQWLRCGVALIQLLCSTGQERNHLLEYRQTRRTLDRFIMMNRQRFVASLCAAAEAVVWKCTRPQRRACSSTSASAKPSTMRQGQAYSSSGNKGALLVLQNGEKWVVRGSRRLCSSTLRLQAIPGIYVVGKKVCYSL